MWMTIDPELLNRLPQKSMNGSAHSKSTWQDSASTLTEFRNEYTEDGWDGQGAPAIPAEVIESAQILAHVLEARGIAAPGWTVPTYESSVAFEWDDSDGTTIEIEVNAPECLTVTKSGPTHGYETWTVSFGRVELKCAQLINTN